MTSKQLGPMAPKKKDGTTVWDRFVQGVQTVAQLAASVAIWVQVIQHK